MHILIALGISIGVLAGVLIVVEYLFSLIGIAALAVTTWPGFVAWACYFAVGGKKEGLIKTLAANTAGILVAMLIVILAGLFAFMGHPIGLAIAVVIGAVILVVQAFWKHLSYIPGAFCGCAVGFGFIAFGTHAFGDGGLESMISLMLSMWIGALFAFASDIWGNAMAKKAD